MRSSLAVKTLHAGQTTNTFSIPVVMAISFFLVSVQSLSSTLRADPLPSVTHHSFTDHGKRFDSSGRSYAPNFLWEEVATLPFVESAMQMPRV